MKRGGQVTIFIIIAVVVIVIIGIFIFINSSSKDNKDDSNDININSNPINSFIQSCLDETLKESIEYIGLQGGYYNDPVISVYYIYHNIPFYWFDGKSEVPEKDTIEQEISEYVSDNLVYCINDYKIFDNSGYEIETDSINVNSVTILDNEVKVSINAPITIKTGDKIVEYDEFSSVTRSDLKKAYDISKQIIEEQKNTPNEMPLGYISELANTNGFKFETITIEDSDVIYTLLFGDQNKPFIYIFATDYDWEVENNETAA